MLHTNKQEVRIIIVLSINRQKIRYKSVEINSKQNKKECDSGMTMKTHMVTGFYNLFVKVLYEDDERSPNQKTK